MGMIERLAIFNQAKDRIGNIEFGDPVTNVCAGDSNSRRTGWFCGCKIKSTKNKYGFSHKTYLAKLTDKKGNFWFVDIEVIFPGHLDYSECELLFKPIWDAHYR